MEEFKSWRDIKEWCEEHGHKGLARRLQLNNDCWNSSGEFGRSQVAICDAMRFAESEEEREEIATAFEQGDELIELGVI